VSTVVYLSILTLALFGAPIFIVMSAFALSAFYFSGIELSAVAVEIFRLAWAGSQAERPSSVSSFALFLRLSPVHLA